jgi:hypothetical protein
MDVMLIGPAHDPIAPSDKDPGCHPLGDGLDLLVEMRQRRAETQKVRAILHRC